MFINKISIEYSRSISFASSIDLFTDLNPIYKAIQDALVKWEFTKEYEHSFAHASGKFIKFIKKEVDFWEPNPHNMVNQYPKQPKEHMFVITIIKLLNRETDASNVEALLTPYKIV